ncbi:MAG: BppU family phage baseplate upper protein [Clostridia bacterium]|nr:BppU family phage baseplate upper protein [Clostridia bacterium]
MNYTNYQITLDITKIQSRVSVPVPQNDTARRFYIRLYHNGNIFPLPDGVRVVFAAEKSDGTVLYNDCIIENESVIRYDFTEQTASTVGKMKCQIRVYGEDGALITSPQMTVVVYESVFSAENIVSSNEYTVLNQLITEANGLIRDVNNKMANGELRGPSGVYVGSGEMPEDAYVQIDPTGTLCFETGVPKILYLDENGEFSLLNAGNGFDIENGTIVAVGDREALEKTVLLEAKVEDLLYKPMEILSFTLSVSTAEKGSVVSGLTYSWKLNKKATALYLDEDPVSTDLTSLTDSAISIRSNATFRLRAEDERGHSVTKNATVSFLSGVYYGKAAAKEAYDSALILSLTKNLRSNKLPSFTVTAGEGEYIYYCLPVSMGECQFAVGGFSGGFSLAATVSFTNAHGYTESYRIYRSDYMSLGKTTVTVS